MPQSKATANDYYSEYPVDIPEAQAQERAERLDLTERKFNRERPNKCQMIVPELPWKRGQS